MASRARTIKPNVAGAKAAYDAKLFQNMEVIWKKTGRQPSYEEMAAATTAYPMEAYAERFGSWLRACTAFIEYRQRTKGNMQFAQPVKPSWSGKKSFDEPKK